MDINIRQGKPEDLPTVLDLIRELARYEKAPDEVEVSLTEMQEWGFGESPLFHFLVAEKGKQVIGLALYYYKYSTWKGKCLFLEDIVVTENVRRQGLGTRLFEEIIQIARKQKVRRLEWQVLNWNQPAIEFYRKFEANFDPEWINCKLTYGQISS